MSFHKTQDQMRRREKTQTLRRGWSDLKPGGVLCAIVKGQGLKKGEKVDRIGLIRVTKNERVRLMDMTKANCIAEGFPELAAYDFVEMFIEHFGGDARQILNRITFEHLPTKWVDSIG